jgi:hypothetical protein
LPTTKRDIKSHQKSKTKNDKEKPSFHSFLKFELTVD